MATVSRRLTEKNLSKKGFRWKKDRGKHRVYVYCIKNTETGVFTLFPHSSRVRDLSDSLISDMAEQCKLPRADFLRLARCPMKQAEYSDILLRDGHVDESQFLE